MCRLPLLGAKIDLRKPLTIEQKILAAKLKLSEVISEGRDEAASCLVHRIDILEKLLLEEEKNSKKTMKSFLQVALKVKKNLFLQTVDRSYVEILWRSSK